MNQSPFTLKGFIKNCKKLLPEYFSSLQDSLESKEELKRSKMILINFLKDYFKQNNNKFGRTQFNVEFLNRYLTEKIPVEYKGFLPNRILQTQKIIRNFVSFLILNNVLKQHIEQKVVRESELELIVEADKLNNQDEELMEEYYKSFEDTHYDKVENWINSFYESPSIKKLSNKQKIFANEIILTFAEYMFHYCFQAPEEWDVNALEEVCLYHFPKNVIEDHDFFTAVSPVLITFLRFLSTKGIIPKTQTNELSMALYSMSKLIVESAMEPKNWGFFKSALMEAHETGVNIQNEEDLNAFLQLKMLEHNEKIISSDFLGLDKVEALSTEDIIKKLRNLGVEFEKEQFLKDVHQFYSASELADGWEVLYHIKAEGQDWDFIWLAAVVLWDRFAPNVVNSEKIERLIKKGYDLLDEERVRKACDVWLETWDNLKALIPPNIKELEWVDGIIKTAYCMSDWNLDFAIYLYNAGLEDAEYYNKRAKYILDVLERVPDSNAHFIFNMKCELAETYFSLGREEKGEKLFEQIVEHYPGYSWGYIAWGDQYSDIDSESYNYEKAKSLYELALQKSKTHKEDVLSRIQSLEEDKDGLQLKKTLMIQYRSSLSEEKLDEEELQTKMEHIGNFLDFVIFILRMISFESIAELLEPKDIRIFLGTWVIDQEMVATEIELIEYCQDIKSFLMFSLSNEMYPEVLLNEIRQICDTEDYFLPFLETYQNVHETSSSPKELHSNLREWRSSNTYSYWSAWNTFNPDKEKEEPEKIRLPEEKRKLFGDMDDFF